MKVTVASDIAEARRLLAQRIPDALVVDMRFGGGEGGALVERLRGMPGGEGPAAFVVGAPAGFVDKVEAIRCGADAYFEQPCRLGALHASAPAAPRAKPDGGATRPLRRGRPRSRRLRQVRPRVGGIRGQDLLRPGAFRGGGDRLHARSRPHGHQPAGFLGIRPRALPEAEREVRGRARRLPDGREPRKVADRDDSRRRRRPPRQAGRPGGPSLHGRRPDRARAVPEEPPRPGRAHGPPESHHLPRGRARGAPPPGPQSRQGSVLRPHRPRPFQGGQRSPRSPRRRPRARRAGRAPQKKAPRLGPPRAARRRGVRGHPRGPDRRGGRTAHEPPDRGILRDVAQRRRRVRLSRDFQRGRGRSRRRG